MRRIKMLQFSERGDTLVEVLIAIAVASLILGGAFVTTNRSLQATRDAQERGNSFKLVESQIERIKNLAASNPDSLFGAGTPASYCISSAGAVVASSNAACTVSAAGNATTTEPKFALTVTRSGNTFTVRSVWTKVSSNVQNNAEMKYRAYE
jgi:prepilin-type N-terminal cleavage/methylation domain-containing protein